MFVHIDTSDRESVDAGVARVVEEFGPVDTLVNNAAAFVFGKVEDVTDDHWAKSVRRQRHRICELRGEQSYRT